MPTRRKTTTSEFAGFIAWDGEETADAGYCLFGCSRSGGRPGNGDYIQAPHLRTRQMLDLLLDVAAANPGAAHVAFAFDYDVNQILRELPWPALITLRVKGKVTWDDYTIEHIPHKIFKAERDGIKIRIDDIFSYFRCRYDKALQKYDVGDAGIRTQITAGKDNRAHFSYSHINEIRQYWALELVTMCQLMTLVRNMAYAAGFTGVTQWHGPGALAAYSLKTNNFKDSMKKSPAPVLHAALSAYAGGWFERFRFGYHDGRAYTADINSAYIYAMSLLPDLARGHWRYANRDLENLARNCRMGLFKIRWHADASAYMRACHGVPFPLFHRDNDGTIKRPLSTDVWLWNPEASNCTATPYATIKEAWIFEPDDPDDYPFRWVADMYANRLELQARGDPAEKILKWAMASYYGRIAQRTGWNESAKTPPQFHQIEYSGWMTSKCRGMIYPEALDVAERGGLVSVDTDGIISTVPFRNLAGGEGNGLGQWKVDEYDSLIYIQNGVYWLRKDGTWEDPKLRGIPRAKLDPAVALDALRFGGRIYLSRHSFRGYGAALQGKRDQWRQWVDDNITINATAAGSRIHDHHTCTACKQGLGFHETLHDLMLVPNRNLKSRAHSLPWMDDTDTDARLTALLAKEDVTDVTWSENIAGGLTGVGS